MQDQVSYILCRTGGDNVDPLVYSASVPARLPPAINIDELTGADPLPRLPSRTSSLIDHFMAGLLREKCLGILWILILYLSINHFAIMTQKMTGQRRVLLIQPFLMTIDETKMTLTMTILMTKTTTLSL